LPKANFHLAPPKKERGLRKTGYTIAGYPFAQFGIPTIIHSKQVRCRKMAGARQTMIAAV